MIGPLLDRGELRYLIDRIDEKYRPVWDGRPDEERLALAAYFLPHRSRKHVLQPSRPRVIAWYCPFASQHVFPSGHRYCVNVYSGCAHECAYCYAGSYQPETARRKDGFRRKMDRDLEELDRFGVPPAPVHLSNSTDPFQPLEKKHGDAGFALGRIAAHRHRFTTVTVLTKNPLLPVRLGYVELFRDLGNLPTSHPRRREFRRKHLPAFQVEVSLAFRQDRARAAYDPHAPTVTQRIKGIHELARAGIPLVLRIDPLFPRSPLVDGSRKTLSDFGLPEAQTLEDLDYLVALAADVGARHIVYSVMKIVQPMRRRLSGPMASFRDVYTEMSAPAKPVFRGGSWRLPWTVAEARVAEPFLNLCAKRGVAAKFCMNNLIETP